MWWDFLSLECRSLQESQLEGQFTRLCITQPRECLMVHNSVLTKRNCFSPFPQYQEEQVLFFPIERKILGSMPPHQARILPDGISALGIWGWAVLTTKLDVHNCWPNGQGQAASARCHQRPACCQQLQECEANVVRGLTFLKAQRESQTRPWQGSQDHLPVQGTCFCCLASGGGGGGLGHESPAGCEVRENQVRCTGEKRAKRKERH